MGLGSRETFTARSAVRGQAIKYALLLLALFCGAPESRAVEELAALPKGVIAYVSTSQLSAFDLEVIASTGKVVGNEVNLDVMRELLENSGGKGSAVIPPMFEAILADYMDFGTMRLNAKDRVRALLLDDEENNTARIAIYLPMRPFEEVRKAAEAGGKRYRMVEGMPDIVRIEPQNPQDIPVYITGYDNRGVVLCDSPHFLPKALALLKGRELPPAPPGGDGAGFGARLWLDLSNPSGELLFASVASFFTFNRDALPGMMTGTQSERQLILSLLRMCAQSSHVSLSVTLRSGIVTARTMFRPRPERSLAESVNKIQNTPPRPGVSITALPADTSFLMAWENQPAITDAYQSIAGMPEVFQGNAGSNTRLLLFNNAAFKEADAGMVASGLSTDGDMFLCLPLSGTEKAAKLVAAFSEVTELESSPATDASGAVFVIGRDAKARAGKVLADQRGNAIGLGTRKGFPSDLASGKERLLAFATIYPVDLMRALIAGTGVFVAPPDVNKYVAWYRKRVGETLRNDVKPGVFPISAAVTLVGGDIAINLRGSLGFYSELIELYQKMGMGGGFYNRNDPSAPEPDSPAAKSNLDEIVSPVLGKQ